MDMANTQLIGPGDPLGNPDAVEDPAVYPITVTNDTFDFQLKTEPTAPEPYMQHKFQDVIVSGQVITDDGSSDLLGPHDTLTSGYDAVAMEPVTLEGHQCLVFFLG